ncbi:MAG: pyruvate phosphate dikinase PEP/pyruvate-binding, partial [Microbacteriaceae bacterium]|nr:pyruvate phosphate dikinase PEP/pyruvate-binding [Microbacteriaceae bacterium]
DEGIVSDFAVLQMISVDQVRQVQRPGFDPAEVAAARDAGRLLSEGIGASPGQVTGLLGLDPDRAVAAAKAGEHVILARQFTSPTDLHGMIAADGIVTATGGATSHAAVVARALGRSCVVGCSDIGIDEKLGTLTVGGVVMREGEPVSIDGATGEVFAGTLALARPAAADRQLDRLLRLASQRAGAQVLVRATTVEQVELVPVGMPGVVASAADILVTSPRFAEVVASLRAPEDRAGTFAVLEDVLADQLAPLFAAAGGMEFDIRAVDFLIDEISDAVGSRTLAVEYPHLAMPLGSEELVRAQLRAINRAVEASGSTSPVSLCIRNVSDVAEARALARLRAEPGGAANVGVGIYITSPRGALAAEALAAEVDMVWIELRMLQAAMFGLPPQHLLTREPLDRYSSRGLLSVNPRDAIDPSVDSLLDTVAAAIGGRGAGYVGIRVSGEISETLVAALYGKGFRRFAVDSGESASARLALGRALQLGD